MEKTGTDMKKVLDEADRKKVVLFSYSPKKTTYADVLDSFMKAKKAYKNKKIIYITSNRTSEFLLKKLKENGEKEGNYVIIDCISAIGGETTEMKNVHYISAPSDFNDLSLELNKNLKNFKNGIIIVDSLTTFLVYNDPIYLVQFLIYLTILARKSEDGLILLATADDTDLPDIQGLVQMMDDVIRKN